MANSVLRSASPAHPGEPIFGPTGGSQRAQSRSDTSRHQASGARIVSESQADRASASAELAGSLSSVADQPYTYRQDDHQLFGRSTTHTSADQPQMGVGSLSATRN